MNIVVAIGDEDHPVGRWCIERSRVSMEAMKSHRRLLVRSSALCVGLLVLGLGAPAAQAQLGGAKPLNIPVKGLVFNPKKVNATVNQKVNFVWKENVAHNIVFDKTNKSPTQNKGTWSTSFKKAGTYKFKCTLHPGMEGQLTVK